MICGRVSYWIFKLCHLNQVLFCFIQENAILQTFVRCSCYNFRLFRYSCVWTFFLAVPTARVESLLAQLLFALRSGPLDIFIAITVSPAIDLYIPPASKASDNMFLQKALTKFSVFCLPYFPIIHSETSVYVC